MTAHKEYICRGYGITDASGGATLSYNLDGTAKSPSYTGAGVGKVDFVVSTDGPDKISESSNQSEPYPVLDCIRYDGGVTGDATDIYTLTRVTRSVGDDGTTFSASNQVSPQIRFGSTTAWLPYNSSWIVEFEVLSMDTALNIYGDSLSFDSISINPGFAVGHTVKIKYNGSSIQLFYNDTASTSRTVSPSADFGVYLMKYNASGTSFEMKIKNFKAYPI